MAAAELNMVEAVRQALREELARDPDVFLMGEDIGAYGGAFKATQGLIEEFGPLRVIDTPLSEAGFVGAAVGAAMMGMKPVVEIQFADFISVCVDPIVNMAAKGHWRYGCPIPLVVRSPSGGGTHGGPFHSQNPEAWFTQVPGLKVVCPSNPYDAKGLLKAAIRDRDPVIFFEPKYLYRRGRQAVPAEDYTVPIGRARVAREGDDLAMITYGALVPEALAAAADLAADGISCQVLDLRTLLPLDRQAIAATVRRCAKVVVAQEAPITCGVAAEVSAYISEHLFQCLDGPITRVGAPDTPVPFAPALEEYFLPRKAHLLAAARRLAAY